MIRKTWLYALAAGVLGAAQASADISFVGGAVVGATTGSGRRTGDGSPLDFDTVPAFFNIGPTGGFGGTSGGLSDGSLLVGTSRMSYDLLAGSGLVDFIRIVVDGAASFDSHGGLYEGSIGSAASAEGSFHYSGPAMPFFAQRIIDGVPVPGPWFTPIPGTGASIEGGIITPGDYSFSLAAGVNSDTNTVETRVSELVIPAPGSALVLCVGGVVLAGRRRR